MRARREVVGFCITSRMPRIASPPPSSQTRKSPRQKTPLRQETTTPEKKNDGASTHQSKAEKKQEQQLLRGEDPSIVVQAKSKTTRVTQSPSPAMAGKEGQDDERHTVRIDPKLSSKPPPSRSRSRSRKRRESDGTENDEKANQSSISKSNLDDDSVRNNNTTTTPRARSEDVPQQMPEQEQQITTLISTGTKTTPSSIGQSPAKSNASISNHSAQVNKSDSISKPGRSIASGTELDTEGNDNAMIEDQVCEPPPPTVDLKVHRMRHLRYHPRPILSMASRIVGVNKTRDCLLAVSRERGSVELRSLRQRMRTISVIEGSPSKPVNTLVWVGNRNTNHECVGASRDGTIFVIDFEHGEYRSITPSGGGAIFCVTSLIQRHRGQAVAMGDSIVGAGCEDGAIRFFRISDEKFLDVVSTIPTAGTSVLSLAWIRYSGDATSKHSSLDGTTLFAGLADGTIRRYDRLANVWKSTSRITVECLGRNTPTRVWALQALDDGTVISGDSLGHVQFWDGNHSTMVASFDQNDNKADVLSVVVNHNQTKVFASGVDSRVVCIERAVPSRQGTKLAGITSDSPASDTVTSRKWILTSAQRPHTHDVLALAIGLTHTKREVLCTGGLDTKLCTYSVVDFQRQRPQSIYPWPSKSYISVSSKHRVLSIMKEERIQLYDIAECAAEDLSIPLLVNEANSLIGTIEIKRSSNLIAADVSPDAEFLAVSHLSEILVFRLNLKKKGRGRTIDANALFKYRPPQGHVATVKFANSQRLLFAISNGQLCTVSFAEHKGKKQEITSPEDMVELIDDPIHDNASAFKLPISSLTCSQDGEWFAAVRNSIPSGNTIAVYHFDQTSGRYKLWWSIPEIDVPHSAVSFLHGDKPQLVVACVNFSCYVYNVNDRCLCEWSQSVGYPILRPLPHELMNRTDYPARIGLNPSNPMQFFMVSFIAQNKAGSYSSMLFMACMGCHPCKNKRLT